MLLKYDSKYFKVQIGPDKEVKKVVKINFDEIILETRLEAEEVLDRLLQLIEKHDMATVSDLYQLLGLTETFNDVLFGWSSLYKVNVIEVRDGFLLDLPKPELIT